MFVIESCQKIEYNALFMMIFIPVSNFGDQPLCKKRYHQTLVADSISKWGIRLQNSSTYSPKRGSASRIFQHAAFQKGVSLEIINIQPPNRGLPLEFINQRGCTSRFHQPKSDPNNQKGVRHQGKFLCSVCVSWKLW